MDRAEIERLLESGNEQAIIDALLSAACYDADWRWVQTTCLRFLDQALQEYSKEAKLIFETTDARTKSEVIVLAEDLVQYALEVAECYAINKRFAGFIVSFRQRCVTGCMVSSTVGHVP